MIKWLVIGVLSFIFLGALITSIYYFYNFKRNPFKENKKQELIKTESVNVLSRKVQKDCNYDIFILVCDIILSLFLGLVVFGVMSVTSLLFIFGDWLIVLAVALDLVLILRLVFKYLKK